MYFGSNTTGCLISAHFRQKDEQLPPGRFYCTWNCNMGVCKRGKKGNEKHFSGVMGELPQRRVSLSLPLSLLQAKRKSMSWRDQLPEWICAKTNMSTKWLLESYKALDCTRSWHRTLKPSGFHSNSASRNALTAENFTSVTQQSFPFNRPI